MVLIAVAVLAGGCRREVVAPPVPDGVVALLYHHLDADAPTASSLSPGEFEAQLAWLKREGYQTLTTSQLLAYLRGEFALRRPSVLITFDDGYESVYRHAWPLLRKYGFSAAVFTITGRRGQTPGEFPHFTWAQAAEMSASGAIEIHSHTHDMHHMEAGGTVPALEHLSDLAVLADLLMSRVLVQDNVGTRASAFAFPFGRYSDRTRGLVEEAGFDMAFTTEPGSIRPGVDRRYLLPRNDVPAGTTIEGFARIMGGGR
jgi:peptidoglycan/xylan/chitin deacetylase (PgdA/CDA1 family)